MPDFVPNAEPTLLLFLKNFAVKFTPYAVAAGVPQAECDAFKLELDTYCSDSETLEKDRATMEQRTDTRNTKRTTIEATLRGIAKRIKAAPGGENAAKDLQIQGSADGEKEDLKPEASVSASPQGVVVKFTNPTRQGVNVYRKVLGVDAKPEFLARDTRSPYIDTEKFTDPKKLEYFVMPVRNDEEVGEPSDVVTITYGG